MSAFGTKKKGSDLAIQMSFPTNFEDAYAAMGPAQQYAPEAAMPMMVFPSGVDIQDQWHQQKMADAHRRVMNAVADTERATKRALVSHAGYWAMPAAVLGQRVYANPSLGSGSADIYKPLHRATPGLTGGVLRSQQGQEYAQKLLQARIAQLNAIDEAAAGLQEGAPITDLSISQGLPEQAGVGPMFKLVSLVDRFVNITESGITGVSRFDMNDLITFMTLLFRAAPQMNEEEIDNLIEGMEVAAVNAQLIADDVDDMDEAGNIALGPDGEEDDEEEREALKNETLTFARTLKSALLYLYKMKAAADLTPAQRVAASRNAIRTLKLTRWRSAEEAEKVVKAKEPEELQAILQGQGKSAPAVMPMTATFTRPAPTREDSEQGARGPRARFTVDERQVFGANSGRWFGQTYETAPEDGTAISHVANAAANGIRNPFRAPGAAADARGDREFEVAMNRDAHSAAELRKSRMASTAAAQKAAREEAALAMTPAVGKGRKRKAVEHPTRKQFSAALDRRVMRRGGSEASKKKVLGNMEKDIAPSKEVIAYMMPKESVKPIEPKVIKKRQNIMSTIQVPKAPEGKEATTGKGKLRLLNQAGKPHRGAHHQMPDGSYHSGAKHTKRSKPLTVA